MSDDLPDLPDEFKKAIQKSMIVMEAALWADASISTHADPALSPEPFDSLTYEKMMEALSLVESVAPMPFNEIWGHIIGIKEGARQMGVEFIQGQWADTLMGIPVVTKENIPFNQILLVKQSSTPFEPPKIYAIIHVDFERKE